MNNISMKRLKFWIHLKFVIIKVISFFFSWSSWRSLSMISLNWFVINSFTVMKIILSVMMMLLQYTFKCLTCNMNFLLILSFLPFDSWIFHLLLSKFCITYPLNLILNQFLSFPFCLKNKRILKFLHSFFLLFFLFWYSDICIH